MGGPKHRWTSEEEASLRSGVAKYGVGKWRAILNDPKFGSTLCHRSNVDLKDKWRNMNITAITSGSREKGRAASKKTRSTHNKGDHIKAISTVASNINDEIVDEMPIAALPSEALNTSNPKKPQSRLDGIIMETIENLNEPMGSHKTTIAKHIEVNRKYRIAPVSPLSDRRSPKMLLLEDVHRKSSKFGRDESQTLTISQIDAELALMTTMTAEEAAAAADRAVAEAETIMAEAEAAAKEAEAAEADAQAAQALADEALLALKNRNATKLVPKARGGENRRPNKKQAPANPSVFAKNQPK